MPNHNKNKKITTTIMILKTMSLSKDEIPEIFLTHLFDLPHLSILNEGMGVIHISGEKSALKKLVQRYRLKVLLWSSDREVLLEDLTKK